MHYVKKKKNSLNFFTSISIPTPNTTNNNSVQMRQTSFDIDLPKYSIDLIEPPKYSIDSVRTMKTFQTKKKKDKLILTPTKNLSYYRYPTPCGLSSVQINDSLDWNISYMPKIKKKENNINLNKIHSLVHQSNDNLRTFTLPPPILNLAKTEFNNNYLFNRNKLINFYCDNQKNKNELIINNKKKNTITNNTINSNLKQNNNKVYYYIFYNLYFLIKKFFFRIFY